MKNLIILFAFGFIPQLSAQNINYEIIKNEPREPKISVNLDIFNLDMNSGIKNIRIDNISMNLGAFGYVKIVDQLEIDFNIHKSWLAAGRLGYKLYPGNLEINTGVNFLLTNRTRVKSTKVILDEKVTETYSKKTTTTTYLMVPTNQQKRFGVRGGLYQKSGPFNLDDYSDGASFPRRETKISSVGLYVGLLSKTINNIIIKDDKYGLSYNSIGINVYFDALIIPVNRFKDLNQENEVISDLVHDYEKTFPIGFRLGVRKYQIEKKEFTGKKFGKNFNFEIGYKPYQGAFVNAGIGITLVKQ